jgi:tetratricopeptide (TPR) repeat protein
LNGSPTPEDVDPQNPTLLYRLALTRYRAGQPALALAPLRRAIAFDAGFDEAHYLLGVVLRDTQDLVGATAALERAILANPSLVAAREELAEVYRQQGRFADEMVQLNWLAAADSRSPRAIAIAMAEARQGRYDAAITTLHAARTREPADSLLALAVGRIQVMRAEATTDPARRVAAARLALPSLEEALGGSARRSEGLALFGRALYLAGDPEGAERMLQEAVATSPFDRAAFGYLADAVEDLGRYAEARDWLMRLDALEGDSITPTVRATRRRRLGGLALAAGDPSGALPLLEAAYQRDSKDVTLLGWLADARWKTNDASGARTALAEGLALAPRDPALRRLVQTIR